MRTTTWWWVMLALVVWAWLKFVSEIWLMLLIVAAAGATFFVRRSYRAADGNFGVVNRFGHFHRLIEPNQITFLLPFVESRGFEQSADEQSASFGLDNLPVRDKTTVGFVISYRYRLVPALVAGNQERQRKLLTMVSSEIERLILMQAPHVAPHVTERFNPLEARASACTNMLRQWLLDQLGPYLASYGVLLIDLAVTGTSPLPSLEAAVRRQAVSAYEAESTRLRLEPLSQYAKDLSGSDVLKVAGMAASDALVRGQR